jgi:LacI family transcriptional regulator
MRGMFVAKKVTIQQIADYLGISNFVVSRALAGKGGVKEETKEKVFNVASQLGYFAQKGSKPFKSEVNIETSADKNSVLIVMPNIRDQLKESIYWGSIINGISDSLERLNLGMVILTESNSNSLSSVLNPKGFLGLIGVGKVSTEIILEVQNVGMPIILIDHEDKLFPTDSIFANNFDNSYLLANHLLGLGHKYIQFLGNVNYSSSFYNRWLGFRTALEEHNITISNEYYDLLRGKTNDDMGYENIKKWLEDKKKKGEQLPTVLYCANDSIAIHVYKVLNELGIKVPDEMSVTGFDNIEDSYLLKPTLTTIDVPKEELGRRAIKALLNRIDDKNASIEKILISGEILFRESVANLKKQNK